MDPIGIGWVVFSQWLSSSRNWNPRPAQVLEAGWHYQCEAWWLNDLECWMYEMIRSLVTLEAKVVCWMLRVFFTNHANGTWTKVFFGISDHSILQRSSRLLVCFPKKVKSLSWCYMDDMQAGSNLFRCCGSCLSDWQRQHRLTDATCIPPKLRF